LPTNPDAVIINPRQSCLRVHPRPLLSKGRETIVLGPYQNVCSPSVVRFLLLPFLTVDGQSSRSSRREVKATGKQMPRRFGGSRPRLAQRAAVFTACISRLARLRASQHSILTTRSSSSYRRAIKNAPKRTVLSGNGGRPSCRKS
jgi:hypothetical protein